MKAIRRPAPKARLRPEVFLRALHLVTRRKCGPLNYACWAVSEAAGFSCRNLQAPEREFFVKLFGLNSGVGYNTFFSLHLRDFLCPLSYCEEWELRKMALALAHTLSRDPDFSL